MGGVRSNHHHGTRLAVGVDTRGGILREGLENAAAGDQTRGRCVAKDGVEEDEVRERPAREAPGSETPLHPPADDLVRSFEDFAQLYALNIR